MSLNWMQTAMVVLAISSAILKQILTSLVSQCFSKKPNEKWKDQQRIWIRNNLYYTRVFTKMQTAKAVNGVSVG